jgi:hypothetical protein
MIISIAGVSGNAASAAPSGIANGTSFTREIMPKTVKVNEKQNITFKYNGDISLPSNIVPAKEIVMLIDTSGSLRVSDEPVFFADYCLFNGNSADNSNLVARGTTLTIEGKIHTNSGIIIGADQANISYVDDNGDPVSKGAIEYVKNHTIEVRQGGQKTIEDSLTESIATPLPDINNKITDYVKNQLKSQVFVFDYDAPDDGFNKTVKKYKELLMEKGYIKELYDVDISQDGLTDKGVRKYKVGGGKAFTVLPNVKLEFKGNVQITNSVNFIEYGIIVANNDITIQGAIVTSGTNATTGKNAEAFFYSLNGNIYNDMGMTGFVGTFYAPKGLVRLNGNGNEITGSVLAKDIIIQNGNNTVRYDADSETNKMFNTIAKPTVYEQVYTIATEYIDKLVADIIDKKYKAPVKVGIITYDSTANGSNYSNNKFYDGGLVDINGYNSVNGSFNRTKADGLISNINTDIKANANIIFNKKPVDERVGKSNLGDALRNAKDLFTNKNTNISKTVIVFSGSNPNTWSSYVSSEDKFYQEKADIDDVYSKYVYENNIKTESDFLASDSYEYASEMSKKLVRAGIVPKFINCLPNDIDNKKAHDLNDIALKRVVDDLLGLPEGEKPSSFPTDKSKLYYDTEGDKDKLDKAMSDISKAVNDNSGDLTGNLDLYFTLPVEVKYTPSGNIQGSYKYTVPKYTLKYNSATKKYELSNIEFTITVKNILKNKVQIKNGKATVDVKYVANDSNKAVLTFDYYGADGAIISSGPIEANLGEDKITLLYEVDVT